MTKPRALIAPSNLHHAPAILDLINRTPSGVSTDEVVRTTRTSARAARKILGALRAEGHVVSVRQSNRTAVWVAMCHIAAVRADHRAKTARKIKERMRSWQILARCAKVGLASTGDGHDEIPEHRLIDAVSALITPLPFEVRAPNSVFALGEMA